MMRDSERQQVFDGWTERHRGILLKIVRMYASLGGRFRVERAIGFSFLGNAGFKQEL